MREVMVEWVRPTRVEEVVHVPNFRGSAWVTIRIRARQALHAPFVWTNVVRDPLGPLAHRSPSFYTNWHTQWGRRIAEPAQPTQ